MVKRNEGHFIIPPLTEQQISEREVPANIEIAKNPEKIARLQETLIDDLKALDKASRTNVTLEDWIKIVSAIFSRPETLEYIKTRLESSTSVSYFSEGDVVRTQMKELFSKFIKNYQALITEERN